MFILYCACFADILGVKGFELQLNKTRAENWRMAANPSGQGRF